jgi:PadR family transcriptional regulator, regulatory protein AphA
MVRTERYVPYASLPTLSNPRLTETSYIVLGLLEQIEPATPYDLKRMAQASTINFWAVPHTQLYTECGRLAQEGLLSEQREQSGRRRRIYRLTKRGRQQLQAWRLEPTGELEEVRDAGTLKLFFGGDPARLAAAQLEAHRSRLRDYEQLRAEATDWPRGWILALEAGIGHERESVRFWSRVDRDTPQDQ